MSYPTYPPPQTPRPHPSVKPIPDGLGIATLILGGLYTAYVVVSFLLSFEASRVYAEAGRDGIDVWNTRFVMYDLVQVAALIALPLYIVACLFLHRARNVADAMGTRHDRSKIWVWLGWWVPIVSFWFPYQVVRDLVDAARRNTDRGAAPLGAWWTCWLVAVIGNRVAANLIPFDGVPDEAMASALPVVEGIVAAATVAGFLMWVRIVRTLESGLTVRP